MLVEDVIVSVIIPVYNEEKFISKCLTSLKNQTYPTDKTEILLIDGGSKDKTVEIIESYRNVLPVRILKNDKKIVTYALNIGIDNAIGKYIVRMDAHSEYENTYIEKCIHYLETTGADNVGGIAITKGIGTVGSANAEILSSTFGVGNSQFRVGAKSGFVDTVPFGTFRREIFDKIGKFNVDLPRSEDNDFNSRIRAANGKVYLAADIQFTYYCRNTLRGLLDQAIKNGNALFLTLKHNPSAMSIRHYIPFLFVLSLIGLPIMSLLSKWFLWLLVIELALYMSLSIVFSLKSNRLIKVLYKVFAFPLLHLAYGVGSLLGMLNIKLY